MKRKASSLAASETGSFAVEASLLFPLIILTTVGCLLLGIAHYRHALAQVSASVSADRAAYVWDNSAKNVVTGAFQVGRYDGLYAESFLDDIKALADFGSHPEAEWILNESGRLPATISERKLAQTAQTILPGIGGTLTYNHGILLSSVNVKLRRPLALSIPFGGTVRLTEAESVSYVVSPEETIRTVDLLRSYAGRLRAFIRRSPDSGGDGSVSPPVPEPEPPVVIRSEADAKAYVRKLVHGSGARFDTIIGSYRQIDAMDGDGVAHEAKYTVNRADADEQIAKDVELMERGIVKGVVWHFFRYQKNGQVQLTDSLRRKLERNGIIVIVHN